MTIIVRRARDAGEIGQALAVRREVFVLEQGVPPELEIDVHDPSADHFIGFTGVAGADDRMGPVVGAGRLVTEPAGFAGVDAALGPVGHLGRLAVRRSARGTGLGLLVVRAIEACARDCAIRVMVLGAQTHAIGFYERLGYTAYGPEFDDAGLPHRWMSRPL